MTADAPSQSRLAHRKLVRLIVTHELAPGALVTEKELITLSGFGRTPVREAIQKLEWQGLMEIRPRSGLGIAAIDEAHPAMIVEALRQLVPLAARLSAGGIFPGDRPGLIGCAQQMTGCSLTGDLGAFLDQITIFDEMLAENCPNPFVARALPPLQIQARRCWYAQADQQALQNSAERHLRVIRALLAGNSATAETEMTALVTGV